MMTMTMTTMIMTTTVVMMIRKSSLHVSFVSLWLLLLWPPICVEGPSRSSIDRAEETHSDQQLDSSLRLIPSFLPLRWTSATRPLVFLHFYKWYFHLNNSWLIDLLT